MKRGAPDFPEMAREWLVRAQGHARAPHEQSLTVLLKKLFDLGFTNGQAAEFARLHHVAEALDQIREFCEERRTLGYEDHGDAFAKLADISTAALAEAPDRGVDR